MAVIRQLLSPRAFHRDHKIMECCGLEGSLKTSWFQALAMGRETAGVGVAGTAGTCLLVLVLVLCPGFDRQQPQASYQPWSLWHRLCRAGARGSAA